MKNIVFLLNLMLILIATACAPKAIIPRQLPKLDIEKIPYYKVDFSMIPKPAKIKPIYIDDNFNQVSLEDATSVLLIPVEYAKISALLKLAKAYKETAKNQEAIINSNIDTINLLKEYVNLERVKAQEYVNMWADAETAYRREQYYHKVDNVINKGTFATLAIGIIIAIIAL